MKPSGHKKGGELNLIFDWVIRIKHVIPFFQSEYDALQLLVYQFGGIQRNGDFSNFLPPFLWRFIALIGIIDFKAWIENDLASILI